MRNTRKRLEAETSFSNTLHGWPLSGEFVEIQLFQLLLWKVRQELAAGAPARLELSPKAFISVELVHQALREPLFRREIVIGVHDDL
jgi:hypothetical protein